MQKKNKLVIILIGPPGSGKGTQLELLRKKFGLECIGSGELLRARKKTQDFTGKKIASYIDKGKRVLTPAIFYLWMQTMETFKKKNNLKGFIIDGSPRTLLEAQILEQALDWYDWGKNEKVIFIKLSSKESIWRLTKRRMCKKCGQLIPYIGKYRQLAQCDKCGGALIARPDDTVQGVKNRLKWFKTDVMPAINYFRRKGVLKEINGDQSIEDVFKDILITIGQK